MTMHTAHFRWSALLSARAKTLIKTLTSLLPANSSRDNSHYYNDLIFSPPPASFFSHTASNGNPFIAKDGRFCLKDGRFCTKEGRFCLKDGRFCTKEGRFCLEDGRFCVKEGRFCTKEGRFCLKDGRFCVKEGRF
jgi:hypothetical protein